MRTVDFEPTAAASPRSSETSQFCVASVRGLPDRAEYSAVSTGVRVFVVRATLDGNLSVRIATELC